MRVRNALPFLLLAGSFGCTRDIKLATSGATGCPPDEVKIRSTERGYSAGYWTAICRGRLFHCSAVSGENSTQVMCTPEISAPRPVETARSVPRLPVHATMPLPKKAGGFRFGATREEAMAACTVGGGNEWSEDSPRYRCSGAAKDMGISVTSELGFCEGGLCDLTLRSRLDSGAEGDAQAKAIFRALREQYGKPTSEKIESPPDCRNRFADCVMSDQARWQAGWRWASGERIIAKTLVDDGHAILAVRYALGEVDDPPQAPSGPDASSF